nr:HNH endonuclease signature motif containing protein [Paraglaciecola chathamensis]
MKSDFDKRVTESLELDLTARNEKLESAPKKPKVLSVTTKVYSRNPDVVAAVLIRAKGICEKCKKSAPFIRAKDNSPYLEVHHKIMLANDGEDTVSNAIALCPNCHRESHYGMQNT